MSAQRARAGPVLIGPIKSGRTGLSLKLASTIQGFDGSIKTHRALAQTPTADRRSSLLPLLAAPSSARLDQAFVRLATYLFAFWWWSLRSHVADRHFLPRDRAVGPPPRF